MVINAFKAWLERARTGRVRMAGLFWFSIAECTVLPIPLEVILFPVMQLNRHKAWLIAIWVTIGALVGALFVYFLAFLAMETIGDQIIQTFGWQEQFEQFKLLFDRYGFLAIVAAGILPIPLQVAMLTAGGAGYSIILFSLAILASRMFRYFGIAWLVLRYGDDAQAAFEANRLRFGLIALVIVAVVWLVLVGILALISPMGPPP